MMILNPLISEKIRKIFVSEALWKLRSIFSSASSSKTLQESVSVAVTDDPPSNAFSELGIDSVCIGFSGTLLSSALDCWAGA